MVVVGFTFGIFAVMVVLRLLPSIIASLLFLLGIEAVHRCGLQILHFINKVLVRLVSAQLIIPPYLTEIAL